MKNVTIGLILPDVLGTYGDDGNALVLRERARRRGFDAAIAPVKLGEEEIHLIGESSAARFPSGQRAANQIHAVRQLAFQAKHFGCQLVQVDRVHVPGKPSVLPACVR